MKIVQLGILAAFLMSASFFTTLSAQENTNQEVSLAEEVQADSVTKANWNPLRWVANYLNRTNKPNDKKFDVSFLLGPSYNVTTEFGLGGLAAGVYSWDREDPSLRKSNVSLFGNASTAGMLMIGVRGNNFLPKEKYRLDYSLSIYNTPNDFWGIGYDNGKNDDIKSNYRRVVFQFKPEFLFRVANKLYIGPMLNMGYTNAYRFTNNGKELLGGQATCIPSLGAGIDLVYDSRDVVVNAYSGSYVQFVQMFFPRFMGNGEYGFTSTELTASKYQQVWKGGVLAGEIHGLFNYGNVPWTMMAMLGTGNRMRGYYMGRYRDSNIIEGQLELRQRIHGRYGAVVWVGAANVFPEMEAIRLRKTLPNYGVGFRWEFKTRMNVRFDLGFTDNKPSLLFNINEAF